MSRSLSWFEPEELSALLSGAGLAVRSVRAFGISLTALGAAAAGRRAPPSTLVGQFGRTNRFSAPAPAANEQEARAALGRFAPAALTRHGPPEAKPAVPFDAKETRLAAGAAAPAAPAAVDSPEPRALENDAAASASFEDRLAELVRWALARTGQARAFVADREGLLLSWVGFAEATGRVGAGVHTLAGSVCPQLESALAGLEGAEQAMARGHVLLERRDGPLAVVWASAPHGRVFLGLAGGTAPDAPALAAVADALRQLLSP